MIESVEQREKATGELEKRRVTMPDGKRYLIYYTFEKTVENDEVKENPQSATGNSQTVQGGENV